MRADSRGDGSDADLIRAAASEAAAFGALYERHALRVYTWCHRRLEWAASDLTAETFAQAWLSRDRFRDEHAGSALPWLLGIARNVLRETIRHDRVETRARERLGLPLDGCLPLRPDEDAVDALDLYRVAGVDAVSINVGFDLTPAVDTFKVLAAFRRGLRARPDRYLIATRVADIEEAKRSDRLAVTFDLEGTEPLDGHIALLEAFYELGVRTVAIAYNRRNRAGGGCHDDPEDGLTAYGRELVSEMNRLGILVDATHCSVRTTFDLFEQSTMPVVFSHSVPEGVRGHARNVTDAQMRACAATGGVIGINGVGLFLGENDASTEALVRAVDYAVGVVGAHHVGLGLDYVFDLIELNAYLEQHEDTFPADAGYAAIGPVRFVSPSRLPELTAALLQLGYGEADVRAILGKNFLRVASQVWRSS